MRPILASQERWIYAITRILVGVLFACHGAQKVLGMFGRVGGPPGGLIWTAGVIELVGAGLVAVGLLASWAAFVCSGEMAVAYFMAHQPAGLLPIMNKGELAALYSLVFLVIAARGSGPWSIDAVLAGDPR